MIRIKKILTLTNLASLACLLTSPLVLSSQTWASDGGPSELSHALHPLGHLMLMEDHSPLPTSDDLTAFHLNPDLSEWHMTTETHDNHLTLTLFDRDENPQFRLTLPSHLLISPLPLQVDNALSNIFTRAFPQDGYTPASHNRIHFIRTCRNSPRWGSRWCQIYDSRKCTL